MGKKLKAIPKFASWEEEDAFWSTQSVTDLNLEEDRSLLVIESGALRSVKIVKIPAVRKPGRKKIAVSKS